MCSKKLNFKQGGFMKKLFVILSITQIILAENIEEEIMNKIDVKKEIEEGLEAPLPPWPTSSFLPPYLAYRYKLVYGSCFYLEDALKPYFYKYLYFKRFKIDNEKELLNYEILFWYLTNSTHILVGEVLKVEDRIIYYDSCDVFCKRAWVKLIKKYKGEFEKNIIPVWFSTCEGRETSPPIYQEVFVRDTCLFFLEDLPFFCEKYIREHGKDINYFSGDFFAVGECGVFLIKEINGGKRILGCVGQDFNLPYENVIDILNTFVPICEKLQEKARKYKFPLKDEEFAEFMKKRGYHYPLTDEEIEKIAKKTEKRRMEVENERKKILGF